MRRSLRRRRGVALLSLILAAVLLRDISEFPGCRNIGVLQAQHKIRVVQPQSESAKHIKPNEM